MRVCFCGDTDSRTVVPDTTSPTRRYRTISNSELDASVPTKPASSSTLSTSARPPSVGEPPRSAIPVMRGVAGGLADERGESVVDCALRHGGGSSRVRCGTCEDRLVDDIDLTNGRLF